MDTGNTGAADTEREQFTRDLYRVCQPAITAAVARLRADERNLNPDDIADMGGLKNSPNLYDHRIIKSVFIDLIGQAYDVFAGSMQGMMLMPAIRAGIQAKLNDLDKQEGQV